MSKDFLARMVELIKEDPELRLALLELITAQTKAKLELAAWRARRK